MQTLIWTFIFFLIVSLAESPSTAEASGFYHLMDQGGDAGSSLVGLTSAPLPSEAGIAAAQRLEVKLLMGAASQAELLTFLRTADPLLQHILVYRVRGAEMVARSELPEEAVVTVALGVSAPVQASFLEKYGKDVEAYELLRRAATPKLDLRFLL